MKHCFLFLLAFLLTAISASAQQPVPAPKKDGEYKETVGKTVTTTGMCKNGHKVGTWSYYTTYGALRREERYDDNGFLTGYLANNGQKWEEVSLKNDKLNGRYRASYTMIKGEDAPCDVIGWYTDDQKDSTWSYFRKYNSASNLWKTESWKKGACVEVRTYYVSGKVFDVRLLNKSGYVASVTYYDEQGAVLGTVSDPKPYKLPDMPPPPPPSPEDVVPPPPPLPAKDSADADEEVFSFAEQMPEFPGGNFSLYLMENIRYPQIAKEMGVQGSVYISFVVNKYGGIENIQVRKGVAGGKMLDEEAKRVIAMMPPWKPGKMNGRPVSVEITQPIKFKLQ